MIMRAKIIEEVTGSNGYKWYVNIPLLYGRPDSAEEKALFSENTETESVETTTSDDVVNHILQSNLQSQLRSFDNNTVDNKEYYTVASVCGIPNTRVKYSKGDIVIVAFENNDMGKPVILGSLLTAELQDKTLSKIELNARSLTVDTDQFAVLPYTTRFKKEYNSTDSNDFNDITVEMLNETLKFLNTLQSLNISLADLVKMKTSTNDDTEVKE